VTRCLAPPCAAVGTRPTTRRDFRPCERYTCMQGHAPIAARTPRANHRRVVTMHRPDAHAPATSTVHAGTHAATRLAQPRHATIRTPPPAGRTFQSVHMTLRRLDTWTCTLFVQLPSGAHDPLPALAGDYQRLPPVISFTRPSSSPPSPLVGIGRQSHPFWGPGCPSLHVWRRGWCGEWVL
jgi:hypothetical protein